MTHPTTVEILACARHEQDADSFKNTFDHLTQCPACEQTYQILVETMSEAGQRSRWRKVLYASLLVLLGLLVGGAAVYRWLPRVSFVAPDERPGRSISSLREPARWRLADAQLPAGTRYWAHEEFVLGREKASAVAVELPDNQGFDLCGFAASGRYLWSLRDWESWPTILGRTQLNFEALTSLVTRESESGIEETICLVVRRQSESCVIFVDSETGVPRGHYVYPGIVGRSIKSGNPISVLPVGHGESRTVALVGLYGDGETASPSLAVFRLDGTLLQDFHFPTILEPRSAHRARHLIVDWYGDPPLTLAQLTDNVHFSFMVTDGQLGQPRAQISDALPDKYDQWSGQRGGWEAHVATAGGLESLLRSHESEVTDVGGPRNRKHWRE